MVFEKNLRVLQQLSKTCFHHRSLSSRSSERLRPVRVRFAPSPTGNLHLGGFRTALLNYLYARKFDGKFILRIEDTDQTRLIPEALENIQSDLKWLGIDPDESPAQPGSHGPYIQSERLHIYEENLRKIIESGNAYECFCTERRLELIRREAVRLRQKPRYDNKCRDLTREEVKRKKASGEQYCVRFKLEPELVSLQDLIYGNVSYDLTGSSYEGDPVIVKSDGYPTYHFANVVDDHYMEISHVLRGIEWQVSTPKHLQMYRAFNWKPPEYAHLPLVMNQDGTKLSKRQGDVSISHYRNETYYPIALTNFVTKSGGGFSYHGIDRLYNLEELANCFEIDTVNTGGCRLDFVLLEKLNQLEFENRINANPQSVRKELQEVMRKADLRDDKYSQSFLEKVLEWSTKRSNKIKDLISPEFEYVWTLPNSAMLKKVSTSPDLLKSFICIFEETCGDSNEASTSEFISAFLEEFSLAHALNHKTFLKDLRLILCGVTRGPPIVEIFQLFGKEIIIERLSNALVFLSTPSKMSHS